MKYKLLVLGFGVFSLVALAIGCSKQEAPAPAPSADIKTTEPAAASALSTADAQKAADAKKAADDLQAADAQKLRDATAQKQAEADKADQASKQAATDKVAADQASAENQASSAPGASNVQALIGSAKALAGENKWADVLKILTQLAGEKLTPAQQTIVDGLKADAQKHAGAAAATKATDAGSALGGLLEPKK